MINSSHSYSKLNPQLVQRNNFISHVSFFLPSVSPGLVSNPAICRGSDGSPSYFNWRPMELDLGSRKKNEFKRQLRFREGN